MSAFADIAPGDVFELTAQWSSMGFVDHWPGDRVVVVALDGSDGFFYIKQFREPKPWFHDLFKYGQTSLDVLLQKEWRRVERGVTVPTLEELQASAEAGQQSNEHASDLADPEGDPRVYH